MCNSTNRKFYPENPQVINIFFEELQKAQVWSKKNPKEIAQIEYQATIEFESLQALQKDIAQLITKYMTKEKMGFNDLVRRLDVSPTQISKIQKGEANLTLSSLAHLAALFNKRPHITFRDCRL